MTQQGSKIDSNSVLAGISVVICTYNGKNVLENTLRHLVLQETKVPFEIILIDNASTDGTKEFVDQWWDEHGIESVAYYSAHQPIPGKSYAQEMGFKMARYNYLLICDDDNWLAPNYIQLACDILEKNPNVAMLGGEGFPVSDSPFPDWFESVKKHYAVGPQHKMLGDITQSKGYVYGAGSLINKAVWDKILGRGVELQLSCRKGESLAAGGDVEMGLIMVLAGYKIYWNPKLKFQHYIPKRRLSKEYIAKMRLGHMQSIEVIRSYRSYIKYGKNTRTLLRAVLEIASSVKYLVLAQIRGVKILEQEPGTILEYFFHAGRCTYFLKNLFKIRSVHQSIRKNFKAIRLLERP